MQHPLLKHTHYTRAKRIKRTACTTDIERNANGITSQPHDSKKDSSVKVRVPLVTRTALGRAH